MKNKIWALPVLMTLSGALLLAYNYVVLPFFLDLYLGMEGDFSYGVYALFLLIPALLAFFLVRSLIARLSTPSQQRVEASLMVGYAVLLRVLSGVLMDLPDVVSTILYLPMTMFSFAGSALVSVIPDSGAFWRVYTVAMLLAPLLFLPFGRTGGGSRKEEAARHEEGGSHVHTAPDAWRRTDHGAAVSHSHGVPAERQSNQCDSEDPWDRPVKTPPWEK